MAKGKIIRGRGRPKKEVVKELKKCIVHGREMFRKNYCYKDEYGNPQRKDIKKETQEEIDAEIAKTKTEVTQKKAALVSAALVKPETTVKNQYLDISKYW